MIRISALNESDANDSDDSEQPEVVTREAQEDEAFSLYNKALQLQNENNHEKAEELYEQLLQTKFLADAVQTEDSSGVLRPNLQLKYSTYKNLANIAIQRQDNNKAMESFLNAVSLDSSDVVVWYKIGITALKIHNYPLSRLAFQEGLQCNSNHWPCLDNLITLLYALNDYATCLYFIAQAFEKEPYYTKGLALRDQIFQEQPSLRRDSGDLFKKCDEAIYKITCDKEEAAKFVEESVEMRRLKRELSKVPEPAPLSFTKPMTSFTWKCLGNCLVALYDHVWDAAPKLSLGCAVNTSICIKELEEPPETTVEEVSGFALAIKDQGIISSDSSTINVPITDMTTPADVAPSTMEVDDVLIHVPAEQATTPYGDGLLSDMSRRMPKRKRILMEFGDPLSKRRSARVRNTGVSKKQDVNYCQILQKFLPKSLKMENTEVQKKLIPLSLNVEKVSDENKQVASDNLLSSNEDADVKNFLQENDGGRVLDIMYNYLIALGERHRMTWQAGLNDEFITVYSKIRRHLTKPNLISQELKNDTIKLDAMFTLTYSELKLDSWHIARLKSTAHSPLCWNNPLAAQLIPDFPGKFFREDLEFLVQLTVRKDILGDDWLDYFMRVMWLRARFLSMQGQMEFAIDSFDRITSCIQNGEIKCTESEFKVFIPNCQVENVITLDQIQTQLETLQRCQSLEEVNCLYEAKEYLQVVELLTATFNQAQSKKQISNKNIPERHVQLQLLQESLWQLGNIQDCLRWSELSFNESIQQYLTLTEKQQKNNWIVTIAKLLTGLEKCISKDISCLNKLEQECLIRFSHNLIQIISIQMELPDNNTTFDSVYPWILLYKIIEMEEKKESKDVYLPGVPASLMLLYNAHEFLGRRSWCCNSDGALLLLYSEILVKELEDYSISESPHPYKEDLELSLEQCYYCLYGHPQKKSKAKHLQEHNAVPISLTLIRAIPIFNYFKPKPLPEFDSHKANTVSAEFEILLRRFKSLIPPQENEATILASVNGYIDGTLDEFPKLPKDKPKTTSLVNELYYLLADYYFKTKEFSKALRYYVTDICFNPERMDSWAAMALARSSQLEQLIHAVGSLDEEKSKRKSSGYLYRKATCALRCFRGAVTINRHNTTLWIEYGSASYMLHSHVSRQLKQKEHLQLSDETVETLTKKREHLLSTAEECFRSANECDSNTMDEEEWLHNYMLGKIAEKQGKNLEVCLKHYSLASALLHEKGARYPRKIQYHNPPDLAMEALEVFYRTHAATLKYLLIHEEEKLDVEFCRVVHRYLKEAATSPFVSFQEKSRYSASLSSSEIEELSPMSLLHPGEHSSKPKSKLGCLKFEHDYFRRKRKDSSTTDDFEMEARKNSIDSSSESLDSATVKDVVNNIVSVVSEKFPDDKGLSQDLIIVLGDSKLRKVNPINKCDETVGVDSSQVSAQGESSTQDCEMLEPKESNDSSNKLDKSEDSNVQQESKRIELLEHPNETKDEPVPDQSVLLKMCQDALRQCLQRFPQHYKSLYRLAYYHSRSKINKQLQWSRDFLLGRSIPWQQLSYMPSQGLFNERKNSNLFNGIWRIPNDEIDRPGSFCSHMYRSVKLLGEVLLQLKDFFVLANLLTQLYRKPEVGKKFLRDKDRLIVANTIQSLTIKALFDEMNKLCTSAKLRENDEKIVKHIVLVSKIWHILTKISEKNSEVNKLLEDVYRVYLNRLEIPETPGLLEQALKFCQQQLSSTRALKVTSMAQMDLLRSSQSMLSQSVLSSGLEMEKKFTSLQEFSQMEKGQLKLPSHVETTRVDYIHNPKTDKPKSDYKEKSSFVTNKSLSASAENIPKNFSNAPRTSNINDTQSSYDSTKKSVWTSNSIPVEGVVIGSMTITPVGASSTNSPSPEGLLSRLPAITKPSRGPLNLSTNNSTRPASTTPTTNVTRNPPPTTSSAKFAPPFDPSRLTADVQSKITSLDPVEHAKSTKALSGYQMEFLKQISQPSTAPVSFKPRGRGTSKIAFPTQSWSSRTSAAIPMPVSSAKSTLDLLVKKEPTETTSSSLTNFPTDLSLSTSSEHDSTPSKPSSLRSIRISTQEPAKRIVGPLNLKPAVGIMSGFNTSTVLGSKVPVSSATTSNVTPFEVITISSGSSPEEIHND